jgi:hypothetical protein
MRIEFLSDMAFDRERIKGAVAKLAARGGFFGTSWGVDPIDAALHWVY